jgi:hypothetical protein
MRNSSTAARQTVSRRPAQAEFLGWLTISMNKCTLGDDVQRIGVLINSYHIGHTVYPGNAEDSLV